MRIVEMVRDDIKNSSLLKTKFLIYAFNGRTHFWPFTMLLHFSLKKNSPKFASVTTRKWGLIAGCCNAFSTKTQCILLQNARQSALKRKTKCSKTRG